jgi:hypothetical protein
VSINATTFDSGTGQDRALALVIEPPSPYVSRLNSRRNAPRLALANTPACRSLCARNVPRANASNIPCMKARRVEAPSDEKRGSASSLLLADWRATYSRRSIVSGLHVRADGRQGNYPAG